MPVQKVRIDSCWQVVSACPWKSSRVREVKILWDFSKQTDHQLEHNRPDLVVDIQQAVCQIIDVAVPEDARVELKKKEKIGKYQDLARESIKRRVVPIVVGALGTIPKGLVGHLESLGVPYQEES